MVRPTASRHILPLLGIGLSQVPNLMIVPTLSVIPLFASLCLNLINHIAAVSHIDRISNIGTSDRNFSILAAYQL